MPTSDERTRYHAHPSCRLDRPFTDRWIVATHIAVLVGQRPWPGPTCVQLITWCPREWVSSVDWTALKGELEIGAYMKRPKKDEIPTPSRSAVDNDFGREHPVLHDYLTVVFWDDDPKQPRVTSTLLVFGQDGCWKACLRDRALGRCCWCAAPSVAELLAALERELAEGKAVWRLDRLSGAPEASRPIRTTKA